MMQWQPIETAPIWILVLVYQADAPPRKCSKDGVFTAVQVTPGRWTLSGPNGRMDRQHFLTPAPSHWQPLPNPPEDA